MSTLAGNPQVAFGPFALAAATAFAAFVVGCASHSENLAPVRQALDTGDFRTATTLLNEAMEAKSSQELPPDLGGDNALMLLDRAAIQQALVAWKASQRDYQAADKAIDMLDLSSNAVDTISEYMFSGSSSRYRAPPYEKLGINTLNMINYLEADDLAGGRVEARRLGVYVNYYRDKVKEESSVLGLGGYLAGFILEKSGDVNGALHFYDDALGVSSFDALDEAVRFALPLGSYRTPRLVKAAGSGPPPPALEESGEGEILLVVGSGRVPYKVANRLPIGLALTFAAPYLSPQNMTQANELAARGAVTWVNFPSLSKEQIGFVSPTCEVDGKAQRLSLAVNVTEQVQAEWKKIEGGIMAAAITRMITRQLAGVGAEAAGRAAGGNEGQIIGLLANLVTQATLTALDKPDTRSWETLPARISVSRFRVAEGQHVVTLSSRGMTRRQTVTVKRGGWAVVSLLAIR